MRVFYPALLYFAVYTKDKSKDEAKDRSIWLINRRTERWAESSHVEASRVVQSAQIFGGC